MSSKSAVGACKIFFKNIYRSLFWHRMFTLQKPVGYCMKIDAYWMYRGKLTGGIIISDRCYSTLTNRQSCYSYSPCELYTCQIHLNMLKKMGRFEIRLDLYKTFKTCQYPRYLHSTADVDLNKASKSVKGESSSRTRH